MELRLKRQFAVGDATIGVLTADSGFTCFTLEDVIRETKIAGKTAIPAGAYPVLLCESPRFSDRYEEKGLGRIVPLLDAVPGYKGVRIHVGNTAEHTEGCILVGEHWDRRSPKIGGSMAAFRRLMALLDGQGAALRIAITNEIGAAEEKMKHPPEPLFKQLYFRAPGTVMA